MDSPHASNDGFFKTCGIQIPLGYNDLPDETRIIHCLPKGFNDILNRCAHEGNGDVTVFVGEKKLYAHKAILRARIPFFESLFNSNMAECTTGEIDMSRNFDGFAFFTIECLLEYARIGQITISVKNVQELIMGAIYMQMESVVEECAHFMRKRISIDNALAIFNFCKCFSYHEIDVFLLTFIDKNIVPISRTPEFIELSVDVMATFLQRDSLNVDNEQQVFEIVDRWIEGRVDGKEHAAKLLKLVRFIHLPIDFITEVIEKKEWVADNLECTMLLSDVKEYTLNKDNSSKLRSLITKRRNCEEAHSLIFSIGCDANDWTRSRKSIMEIYNPITNTWNKCDTRGLQISLFSNVVAVNQKIYFFGGHIDGEQLDTVTNEWRKMPFLTSWRIRMAHCVIDGKIYIAGGDDGNNALSIVETYDPEENSPAWKPLASMGTPRTAAGCCVLNGKLYVIGGCNLQRVLNVQLYLNDGEIFDPDRNSWSPIAPMSQGRRCFGMAAFKGKIYAVGGYCETGFLDVVERYDPETDTWSTLNSLKAARHFECLQMEKGWPYLVVSCGKLFLLGGDDEFTFRRTTAYLTSVEMYNDETDSWEEMASMMQVEHSGDLFVGTLSLPASFPTPAARIETPFASVRSSGFGSFHMKEELLKAISDCGFKYPSEIQHEFIPQVIRGMNVKCQAKSGMGKTTTFVIGTLEHLEPVEGEVSVLVLCNTHELADKISKRYDQLMTHLSSIKVSVFCGDVPSKKNKGVLKKTCPHIVIGTPGRILSLAKSGALKLNRIKQLVIDECCEILKIPDITKDVERIFKYTPENKQVLLFSANALKGTSFTNV